LWASVALGRNVSGSVVRGVASGTLIEVVVGLTVVK
jgi:hypothetical protein